ncbi:copper transporter [Paramaledivibacter caminithermalis]|jgi:hypothetical protein|uniref:Copper transport outer membrane protein, MctB n=1 Tax=Paramaledivibacter caminithermalis (strain DSM 15212 / CIP 107654 / DViRD3) TaxID=1121301 RepID=A0A1M6JPE5_PARC5|nr:copper transporter [Paramaledivibacter caminithermalis]SHJ48597.1 Copper transport outer membrane protein, MctB [Paramaledivibacter caminithermalis DSM 15212]
MVINIKHFIITIIAIFLSLGIGIFVGVIIDSQQLFIEQQKVLVSQIEEGFDGFKQKNYELMSKLEKYREDNERKDKFLDIVYYDLCQNSLNGLNIMTIDMFTENDYFDVEEIFNNTKINKIIKVNIPKVRDDHIEDIVKTLKSNLNIESQYENGSKIANSEKIYSKTLIKSNSTLPFYLRKMDHVNYKGDIYSNIDFIILIDDGFNINNQSYTFVRKEFINLINNSNIPLMAVEKSNTTHSCISFYKEHGISTVDNVDTKLGQIAMLMILKGKKGHFGEKVTADSLIPKDILSFDVN